ncbi:MAG: hypothetical protein ACJ8F7_23225 [Gemmataceae bacterium]
MTEKHLRRALMHAIEKRLGDRLATVLAARLKLAELQELNAGLDDLANRCLALGRQAAETLAQTKGGV